MFVALRKESVDRNLRIQTLFAAVPPSLSARRAWIEILSESTASAARSVALRKESVDRNWTGLRIGELLALSLSARRAWIEIYMYRYIQTLTRSLSARRAWIEIAIRTPIGCVYMVALRKESVDRNTLSTL